VWQSNPAIARYPAGDCTDDDRVVIGHFPAHLLNLAARIDQLSGDAAHGHDADQFGVCHAVQFAFLPAVLHYADGRAGFELFHSAPVIRLRCDWQNQADDAHPF